MTLEYNTSQVSINPDFSKRITALRFLLSVFVVFIHAVPDNVHFSSGDINCLDGASIWIRAIVYFFAQFLGQIAVPMFFIISGYLFFAKPKPAIISIKSKSKTIALPYFLWNVIAIVLIFIAQSISYTESYFPQNLIKEWSFKDYLLAFWSNNSFDNLAGPVVAQFWYIRDLLCLMIISPLIKIIARKYPYTYITVIALLYIFNIIGIIPDYLGFVGALFYFSIGYYAVKYIEYIMQLIDSVKVSDAFLAFILVYSIDLYGFITQQQNYRLVHTFSLFFLILFFVKIAGFAVKEEIIFSKLSYLAGFSFWIYAAHKPFVISVIKRLHIKFLPMEDGWILLQFFGDAIVCVGLLMLLAVAIKKYCPKIWAILNGNR